MKRYDALLTFGNGLDKNWQVPEGVLERLILLSQLYKKGVAPRIVVCGKWSINWDVVKITPPTTESEVMKADLIKLGVRAQDIIKEEESKDTIGNIYFFKTRIARKYKIKTVLLLCPEHHAKRIAHLFEKIAGQEIAVTIQVVPSESFNNKVFMTIEEEVLQLQSQFLKDMKDDSYLEKRLYEDSFYAVKKLRENAATTMHGAK